MDLLFPLLPIIILILFKLYLKLTAGVCHSKNTLENKVIIVTGANSGIGFETALDLAARKGKIILACRSIERGLKAAKKISDSTGNQNLLVRQLDLSSLSSVKRFAADIIATEERLDVLIHNAGVTPKPGLHLTEDNLELQFATNHFGPFLLTHLLLDLLKKTAPSRIVVVSSVLHWFARLDMDNLNCEKFCRHPLWVYYSTKLSNILFVRELSRRLQGTGVTANALHPGGVRTAIFRNAQWFIKYLIVPIVHPFLKNAKSGAQTSIYLAVAGEVKDISGKYFVDCKPSAWMSPLAKDDEIGKQLWEKSEQFTGLRSIL